MKASRSSMPTLSSTPAFLLASSLFSNASRVFDSLLDSTFTDIYRLQPFDYAILAPYFAGHLVISLYGLHLNPMLHGY
jgi:hypothetical protein